jgi:Tol biopolymer transport system component
VFVHDRTTGTTTRVSVRSDGRQGNGPSVEPAISGDGRFVTFWSDATNLVANDTNGVGDVFVHDRTTGTTTRVSVRSDGGQGIGGSGGSVHPAISADGRFVTFSSGVPNLIANDTNGTTDVFVHDRTTGRTRRVSVSSGEQQADEVSSGPAISADGRFVAFWSNATNLVQNDTNDATDVFVRDRASGRTRRVSISSDGDQGDQGSFGAVGPAVGISSDGRFVTYASFDTNLVPNDTNGITDVFVRDRATSTTTRVSLGTEGNQGDAGSYYPAISADGRFVAFNSASATLVPNDTNGLTDVFVRGPLL